MNAKKTAAALLMATMAACSAWAEEDDVAAGAAFYASQCKVCHGLVTPPVTGESRQRAVSLAMQQSGADTMRDVPLAVTSGWSISAADTHETTGGLIAVAPPYGPNLRGVYGRTAGTIEGFVYSNAFQKALKGMEWNDASLDVWIANPQKWVPGVYMFYKQADPEVRRKIILYLKAN